jgi:hypothetical protein
MADARAPQGSGKTSGNGETLERRHPDTSCGRRDDDRVKAALVNGLMALFTLLLKRFTGGDK